MREKQPAAPAAAVVWQDFDYCDKSSNARGARQETTTGAQSEHRAKISVGGQRENEIFRASPGTDWGNLGGPH